MDDPMTTHGAIGWCELVTDDVDAARDFYTEVIGWSPEVVDVGLGPYTMLKAGDRPVAGIMRRPPETPVNHWGAYVTVDDVDARVARVAAAGGSVLFGPMDIPRVGRMAIIADPTGGAIGIITYERPAGGG